MQAIKYLKQFKQYTRIIQLIDWKNLINGKVQNALANKIYIESN